MRWKEGEVEDNKEKRRVVEGEAEVERRRDRRKGREGKLKERQK